MGGRKCFCCNTCGIPPCTFVRRIGSSRPLFFGGASVSSIFQHDHHSQTTPPDINPSEATAIARSFKDLGGDLLQGRILHADVERRGLLPDSHIGSAIVGFYGRCGDVAGAEYVFGRAFLPDVVVWNAMLSSYVRQGLGRDALSLYRQMREEGLKPNVVSFVCALQACAISRSFASSREIAMAVHSEALRCSPSLQDARLVSSLITVYSRCGMVAQAEQVFITVFGLPKNVVSWNAMLSAYVEQGRGRIALQMYVEMVQQGIQPDELTMVFVLQACGTLAENDAAKAEEALEIVRALHAVAQSASLSEQIYLGTTLVNVYGKCGSIAEAEQAFHTLSWRNVVSWNAMLSAYVEQGQVEKALLLFRQMVEEASVVKLTDQHTLMFAIQACTALMEKVKTLEKHMADTTSKRSEVVAELGMALHAQARRMGFLP